MKCHLMYFKGGMKVMSITPRFKIYVEIFFSSSIFLGTAVTLYRVKNHVDISSGPMVANSNFLGRRCTIAAVSFLPFFCLSHDDNLS